MGRPEHFVVKNWMKFQHYKDRNPPWIKLHVEILASEDWVTLADASRLLAVVCMVIAAKNDGRVPNNPDYIKRVAYLDRIPDLTPLVKCGFLVNPLADASESKQTLATARPEAEAYSTETESHTPRAKGTRLGQDWKPSEGHFQLGEQLNLQRGEVIAAAVAFCEYFHSPDATRPVKKDWDGAFSRWLRTDAPKIVANRARRQQPGGNQGSRGSVTAARDSILAKAGILPVTDGVLDQEFQDDRGSRPGGNSARDRGIGPIIDADEWTRSPGPSDGDEGAYAPASRPDDSGHGNSVGGLSQAGSDVSSGRSAPCANDAARGEPMVALVAGTQEQVGDSHLPQTPNADGLDIPGFLRRT